jgi:hypothetical protein
MGNQSIGITDNWISILKTSTDCIAAPRFHRRRIRALQCFVEINVKEQVLIYQNVNVQSAWKRPGINFDG